jgi:hypothetical protein
MDAERSSLCNCVVNFLLEENYLLSAFELLQELLDDHRDAQAIRLKEFFSDPSQFPPDQITRLNTLRVADPQTLLEEKEALEEKLAISEYELRLAQEDILKLKSDLQKNVGTALDENGFNEDASANQEPVVQQKNRDMSSDLGSLKENERRDLNCAVKEYLLLAGYRLTAMTFVEEVTDQNLKVWPKSSAFVPDALRHYYYQYLSFTSEAAEEKIAMLKENDSLLKESARLKDEMKSLIKNRDLADGQVMALTKSLESMQKDIKEKEILVQELKKSLDRQRKELNDCRAEITSLKLHIEGTQSGRRLIAVGDVENGQPPTLENYRQEIELLQNEVNRLTNHEKDITQEKYIDGELHQNDSVNSHLNSGDISNKPDEIFLENSSIPSLDNGSSEKDNIAQEDGSPEKPEILGEPELEKMGLGTIQILSDALPKIVPFVLINGREELLPLIMCAIERHPDTSTRDSLTHTLFNLIKRPDEQQRRIIMDACVTLSKNVGEMRTETELLPQCWEQINHTYEERRLLVAQSCGELAEFVRPEIRDSLILSIVQQLIEDSAAVVREAAAHNLALLLPLFPNSDKYFKVEEMMFQLLCDKSGVVGEITMKQLVPALVNWGNKLDHILSVLFSYALTSAQNCPPLSAVEGSVESNLHVLGVEERSSIDVLLRLLMELLQFLHQKTVETCPFPSVSDSEEALFSMSSLELYAGGHVEWPTFEWFHLECFPNLINLASMLTQKEDSLRNRITQVLLAISELFGNHYLTHIMLPVFLVAVGDDANLSYFPPIVQPRIRALRPKTAVAGKLATKCVLPLLLTSILGSPSKQEELTAYLKNLLGQRTVEDDESSKLSSEIIESLRYLCTFEEHHTMIFNVLWEMVVSSNVTLKINAANFLKVIVPYIDAKVASTHVLPALVTLGSDQDLNVKYSSIDAFGAVAQHFKNDMIVDKIRVQMDAFLEDGSHEATIAVVRALVVAVPHTVDRLRDYLLSKIFQLTAKSTLPASDIMRRRERANAFCECIRALDATELPGSSVTNILLPAIQNLLKDSEAIDPAHKEALEIIVKDRSGGTFEFPKNFVSNLFGEGGLLGAKKGVEIVEQLAPPPVYVESHIKVTATPPAAATPPEPAAPLAEDTRFRRIMMGGFGDILRGKPKTGDDTSPTHQQH